MALTLGISADSVIAVGSTRLRVVSTTIRRAVLRWHHGATLAESELVTVDNQEWVWISPVPVEGTPHIVRLRLANSRTPRLVLDAPQTVNIDRDPEDADDFL